MRRRAGCRSPALTVIALVWAGACTPDMPNRPFSVRDSAGTIIAESKAPAWADGEGWNIDTIPLFDIGSGGGGPGQDLSGVIASVRMSDSRVLVADGGSRELRFYDGRGNYLESKGRDGEGPGEYRSLSLVARLPNDSILVYDVVLNRLTVLLSDGTPARMTKLQHAEIAYPVALLDSVLLLRRSFMFNKQTPGRIYRDSVPVTAYALDGTFRDTIGYFPSGTTWVFHDGNTTTAAVPYFEILPQFAGSGNDFLFGTGAVPSFEVRRQDGSLEKLVRLRRALEEVTRADVERRIDEDIARRPDYAPHIRRMAAAMPIPRTFPAYSRFASGPDGEIWVRDYSPDSDTQPATWQILDPDGRWLGAIDLPARFDIQSIGTREVLGVWRDAYDVEHVRAYRVNRRTPK